MATGTITKPQEVHYIDFTKTTDGNGFATILPSELPTGANVISTTVIPPFPTGVDGSIFVLKTGKSYHTETPNVIVNYSTHVVAWNNAAVANTSVIVRVFYC